MAKNDLENLADLYAAAAQIVERGLRRDDSLFTPGTAIWSVANFEELDRYYVQAPDLGEGTFGDKLRAQLAEASANAKQLMAELHYVYYLPASVRNVSGRTKRQRIAEVLSWTGRQIALPPDLDAVLDKGVGGVGQAFGRYGWASLSYLARFGLTWKRMPAQERQRALDDPWTFLRIASAVPTTGGGTYAREALLHLVHPDAFERIFAESEKHTVAGRFKSLVSDHSAPVDQRLAEIRGRLEQRFGAPLDFYWTVPVMAMWKPSENRWKAFLYWAGRTRAEPAFESVERKFKLELAGDLAAARQALLGGGDDWLERLDGALRRSNLVGWREADSFLKWSAANRDAAAAAFRAIWDGDDRLVGLSQFLSQVPDWALRTPGQRTALGAVLLMAIDAPSFPPYRPTPLQLAYQLTDFGAPATEETARYRQALDFFDTMLAKAQAEGVELRDRLDAQTRCGW